ncbi:uncharacterized protein BJ212DRAFT_1298460 [Suillus subaureus]|uniref:Uncharacterized protein n=1 Tax=Suillus subaureus TaxID=48587 RepID=A0A9P7EF58_9AGAM|nr:uncharacterized protein BJ212DRAFT_1298460 [Suillus subaureus]KAG1819220.1 hypothetical protein BJ212DRAFT_1298460 [Suillus subaureus]
MSCACVFKRKFLSLVLPQITLDQQAAISLRDYSLVKFLGDLHLVPVPDASAAYMHSLSSSAQTHNRWSIPPMYVMILMLFPTFQNTVRSWQSGTGRGSMASEKRCQKETGETDETRFDWVPFWYLKHSAEAGTGAINASISVILITIQGPARIARSMLVHYLRGGFPHNVY